jgi:hypothetical protein
MQIEGIFRLAHDRARTGFAVMVDAMFADADAALHKASQGPTADNRQVTLGRALLRDQGPELKTMLRAVYDNYLSRAMQTMHVDQRRDLSSLSIDSLTLIEDDVVTRQIEVDRILVRLRDADQVNLGRISATIAHLHGTYDVRERENPFRPYLLARSLHEGLHTVSLGAPPAPLMEQLAVAMARHMPKFYGGILQVFEERTELPKLQVHRGQEARPDSHGGGYAGGQGGARPSGGHGGGQAGGNAGGHLAPAETAPAPAPDRTTFTGSTVQELLASVFAGRVNSQANTRPRDQVELRPVVTPRAEAGPPAKAEAEAAPAEPALSDLVDLIFDAIGHDTLLPSGARARALALKEPFTRAVLQEPSLLLDPNHPARTLLARIGSIGAGLPASVPGYLELEEKMDAIVKTVETRYTGDNALFREAERGIDSAATALLRTCTAPIARCAEAAAEAEIESALVATARNAITMVIDPLRLDTRFYDFLTGPWARVLALAPRKEQYVELLPQLLWSAQPRTAVRERPALMASLADLARQVREGLAQAGMTPEEVASSFEQLAAVHMDVLGNRMQRAVEHKTLEEMHTYCIFFELLPPKETPAEPPTEARLAAALRRRGLEAELEADAEMPIMRVDWLKGLRPGMAFEVIQGDEKPLHAWIAAVSPGRHVYVLGLQGRSKPAVYTDAALQLAARDGLLRLVEYAPLFDRAVESLLAKGQQEKAQASA